MSHLTPEQAHSSTWHVVKEYAENRLMELRARLEADLNTKQTAATRAAIKEVNRLLELDSQEQELIDDE